MPERGAMATDLDRANLLTELRHKYLVESAKALIWINGGGAVAIAAALQAFWDKWPPLAVVLGAIAVFPPAMGAVIPAYALRGWYEFSLDPDSTEVPNATRNRILRLYTVSGILFMIGMVLLGVAALLAVLTRLGCAI